MKKSTSERLHELSNIYGITQADMCKKTGIAKSTMSLYWSGQRLPKQNMLTTIAQAYDLNEAWLMGYDVQMKKPTLSEIFSQESAEMVGILRNNILLKELVALCINMNDDDLQFMIDTAKRIKH